MSKGILLVISGPSGCGKGTVCSALKLRNPGLKVSISATTREIRPGEAEGVNYYYKTREEFTRMVENNELLEHAEIYGNCYGTPRAAVQELLEKGEDVILEIEMQGALQVKERFPEAVMVFLLPPSLEELRARLIGRGRETEEQINERFRQVGHELEFARRYTYVIVNDTVEETAERIETVMAAERFNVARNGDLINCLMNGNK